MINEVGGKRFRRKASTVITEINVTPFVDVMLVLLIIFMVTTPLMQSGVNVDLPKQDSGFLEISEKNVVTLRRDGSIYFNEKRVTLKDLEIGLKSIAVLAPSTEVYLRADRKLDYGSVVGVMGVIKRAGISRLGMVTEVSPTPGKKKRTR